MPWLEANGLRIWCERRGKGPPLLCLTGTGADLRKSPTILDSLFVEHFDVATYDQRGLGRTDKPDGSYGIADYAQDAIGVLNALGWGRAHILGISFGGLVAQELAIRAPAKVAGLVLCCTTAGGAGGSLYPQHLLHHLSPRAKALHMLGIADCRRDALWQADNPELVEQILAAAERDPYATQPGMREGRRKQIDARGAHDAWERLDLITAPTLVAIGRYDRQAPPASSEAMASRIFGSTVRHFEGGHRFLDEDPIAMAVIVEFLLQHQS